MKMIKKILFLFLVLGIALFPAQSTALPNCADVLVITHTVPQIPSLTEERGSPPSLRVKSNYYDKWWFNDSIGNSSDFFYVTVANYTFLSNTPEGKTQTRSTEENTVYYQPTKANNYFAKTGKSTVGYMCEKKLTDEFSFKYEKTSIELQNENLTAGFKKVMSTRWDAFWFNGINSSEFLVLTEKTGTHKIGEVYYKNKDNKYVFAEQYNPGFTRVQYAACCELTPTPTPEATAEATVQPTVEATTKSQSPETTPEASQATPTIELEPATTNTPVAGKQDSNTWIIIAVILVMAAAAVFYTMAQKPQPVKEAKNKVRK